jgi:hypothetical protein
MDDVVLGVAEAVVVVAVDVGVDDSVVADPVCLVPGVVEVIAVVMLVMLVVAIRVVTVVVVRVLVVVVRVLVVVSTPMMVVKVVVVVVSVMVVAEVVVAEVVVVEMVVVVAVVTVAVVVVVVTVPVVVVVVAVVVVVVVVGQPPSPGKQSVAFTHGCPFLFCSTTTFQFLQWCSDAGTRMSKRDIATRERLAYLLARTHAGSKREQLCGHR